MNMGEGHQARVKLGAAGTRGARVGGARARALGERGRMGAPLLPQEVHPPSGVASSPDFKSHSLGVVRIERERES